MADGAQSRLEAFVLKTDNLNDFLVLPWAFCLRCDVIKVLRCLRIFWRVVLRGMMVLSFGLEMIVLPELCKIEAPLIGNEGCCYRASHWADMSKTVQILPLPALLVRLPVAPAPKVCSFLGFIASFPFLLVLSLSRSVWMVGNS